MHMTKVRPTQPGYYWWKPAGSRERLLKLVRVIRKGKHLFYATGPDYSLDWAVWDRLDTTHVDHLWSNEPLPEPTKEQA